MLLFAVMLWLITGLLFLHAERWKQIWYPTSVKYQRALSHPTSSWTRRAENASPTQNMTSSALVVQLKSQWCSPEWGNIGLHVVSTSLSSLFIIPFTNTESLFLLQIHFTSIVKQRLLKKFRLLSHGWPHIIYTAKHSGLNDDVH